MAKFNQREVVPYVDGSGDTFRIETRHYQRERQTTYLVWQWDRDWGRCTGGSPAYPFPPDHLWHCKGDYIVDDFGNLVRYRPSSDSGRDIMDDNFVWVRDRYTGAMSNQPVEKYQ